MCVWVCGVRHKCTKEHSIWRAVSQEKLVLLLCRDPASFTCLPHFWALLTERPREDTARHPSAIQKESLLQKPALPAPWSWMSSLQGYEKNQCPSLKPPSLWHFAMAEQTNTGRLETEGTLTATIIVVPTSEIKKLVFFFWASKIYQTLICRNRDQFRSRWETGWNLGELLIKAGKNVFYQQLMGRQSEFIG